MSLALLPAVSVRRVSPLETGPLGLLHQLDREGKIPNGLRQNWKLQTNIDPLVVVEVEKLWEGIRPWWWALLLTAVPNWICFLLVGGHLAGAFCFGSDLWYYRCLGHLVPLFGSGGCLSGR